MKLPDSISVIFLKRNNLFSGTKYAKWHIIQLVVIHNAIDLIDLIDLIFIV